MPKMTIEAITPLDPAVPYRRVRRVVISKREGPAGSSPTYFVKTSAKQVYQFGREENLLCQLLDGKRSFPEIQSEFKRQIGAELTREQFDGLLTELLDCGIVEPNLGQQDALGKSIEDEPKALKDELQGEIDNLPAAVEASQLPPGAVQNRFAVRFFDPAALLQALDWLAGPLRYYRWLLLPAAFFCLIAAALSTEAMGADLSRLTLARLIASVAIALLLVDVVPAIAQAAVASFFGFSSRVCGVGLRFGVLPRLRFSDADWRNLRAEKALQVTAAPLMAGLALFAAGTGTWLLARQNGDWLPISSLIIGQAALCAVVAGATPFAATSGRKWLTTLFGRSELWRIGGFYRAHLLALSGLWSLGCAGLVSLYLSVAAHAGAFGSGLPGLWPILDTITLALLTIVPLATWIWLRVTVNSQGVAHVVYLPDDGVPSGPAPPAEPPGIVVPFDREAARGLAAARRRQADSWPSARTAIVVASVMALVLAFAFIPYPYEAGGNFTILPHDSSQLNARVQGELTEVLVNENDWVAPGQTLGILSDWDQQANLAVSKAQLENAKANLQALQETPKPEDVELARKQYELAASKLPYDKAQYERAAELVTRDVVTRSYYDQTVSTYQQDQAAEKVARANYDSVRTGPTPGQLDAALALERQYAATVAYNEDQLQRTRVQATSYGTVVTPNPMLLRGQWFAEGQLVFTVQDLRTVQADVQVPETDIGHVQIGGGVRIRPWAFPEAIFPGTAIAIADDAQKDPGGSNTNIVRVRADIPNPDGALRATMSGYAKIIGPYMPAWKAFTQMLIRFFMVTIWSFIP